MVQNKFEQSCSIIWMMFQDDRRLRQGPDVDRGGRAGQADGQEELSGCSGQSLTRSFGVKTQWKKLGSNPGPLAVTVATLTTNHCIVGMFGLVGLY